MQCNGMQGLCAQLTRGVHLPYIYKQCNDMQGLCAQMTRGGSSPIYI